MRLYACVCCCFHATGRTAAWIAARDLVNSATLRIFAEQGADLQFLHPDDRSSLLHAAVLGQSVDTVNFLGEASELMANQHTVRDSNGATALHLACSLGLVDIVR